MTDPVGPAERDSVRAAQIADAAESRLRNPRAWFRELAAVSELLEPGEAILDLSSAYWGRLSMSAGVIFETSERLIFVSFGFLRRQPIVRSARFDEIAGWVTDSTLRIPRLILRLDSGRRIELEATRPDRDSFTDLIASVRRRRPSTAPGS